MINGPFRPWGTVAWLLPKLGADPWHIVGALATEDRCLSAIRHGGVSFTLAPSLLYAVEDPDSQFANLCAARRAERRAQHAQLRGAQDAVEEIRLLCQTREVRGALDAFVPETNGRIVLDISALPKRFFFPILRWLVESPHVRDLVITYMSPMTYHSGELAFEPGDWAHLPTYQSMDVPPVKKAEKVIVGVGFIPFGLPTLLKDNHADADVVLIFPFPPGAPSAQRTWKFVAEIENVAPLRDDRNIRRVDVADLPACYGEICALTDNGQKKTVFAPYGPKAHAAAMALFALKHGSDVFYTQPRYYHPEYTTGTAYDAEGRPKGSAYLVKRAGQALY
jgi:hypothetical protein